MQQFSAIVMGVDTLSPALRVLWLAGPSLPHIQPGQFIMARCGDGVDPLLRKALSVHRRPRADGAVGFMFGVSKPWGQWLAKRAIGETVDVIAPLGRGFQRDRAARHLLMVAEDFGIAALVALAEQSVADGRNVTLVAHAATASRIYPAEALPAEIEYVTVTSDGSTGRRGRAIEVVAELLPWADQIFLAGSMELARETKALLKRRVSRTPAQAAVEERMACGVGVCLGCVVDTVDGYAPSCTAGPVFDLWRLAA
ncbi:MAG: hypothetical protein NZ518_08420 [Dehalococcoidia bacterium]|nr:hypothetical protein [Dehalococcoidia bacterium]